MNLVRILKVSISLILGLVVTTGIGFITFAYPYHMKNPEYEFWTFIGLLEIILFGFLIAGLTYLSMKLYERCVPPGTPPFQTFELEN